MKHITEPFAHSLTSAIERIIACLDGLDADGINWKPQASEPTSSLYVLAVHTMANAEYTVLTMLAGENIPRDRDAEFAAVGTSADWVHQRWADLKPRLEATIHGLSMDDLIRDYEHARRGTVSGWKALVMVTTHANEHVGHAELTRDLLKAS
jgi:hypothetical protein